MIKGFQQIPKFVRLTLKNHYVILRLTDKLKYRKDAGAWEIDAELFPDGKLISISEHENLNNILLEPATEKDYIKDNKYHLYLKHGHHVDSLDDIRLRKGDGYDISKGFE